MVGTDFYKIGLTTNTPVKERFSKFCCNSPLGGEIIRVIESNSSEECLEYLYKSFESKRKKGKFFKLDDDDLQLIDIYVNEKSKELEVFYWENIIGNGINIKDLKKALILIGKHEKERLIHTDLFLQQKEDVLKYIYDNLMGHECSNTEILEMLIDDKIVDPLFSSNTLGRILKPEFKQKVLSVEGHKKRVYYL